MMSCGRRPDAQRSWTTRNRPHGFFFGPRRTNTLTENLADVREKGRFDTIPDTLTELEDLDLIRNIFIGFQEHLYSALVA